MENLRQRLIEKQQGGGWNDAEFARLLGVSRVTWNQIKNGKTPVGPKVAVAVIKHFPSLTDEVITSLTAETGKVA